jgi:FkbM family methyltransferase
MSTYLEPVFTRHVNKTDVKLVFELGSRDLKDAAILQETYACPVYAFECNPDCLIECDKLLPTLSRQVNLVRKAVALEDGTVTFFPFDRTKYDNMGCSSMLKIDFSGRSETDPDRGRPNPQKEVTVESTRLDTFCRELGSTPDMLCIDLQGYELNALKSMGSMLTSVKYIITESSITSTFIGGATFAELDAYLSGLGFRYVSSTISGVARPPTSAVGFSEFDCLFVRAQ